MFTIEMLNNFNSLKTSAAFCFLNEKKCPLIILTFVYLFACQQSQHRPLTIAVAANVQFAMDSLVTVFHHETGIDCELVLGSSGKLTAQIREGAPYDVFLSANMKYPKALYQNGLTAAKPEVYAYGQLVLWLLTDTLLSVGMLAGDKIQHIVMANPKIAPYGLASIEVLKYYGLYDSLYDRLVYGESISQVNQFITSQTADAGFTAKSAFVSGKMTQQGKWLTIDNSAYTPIAQGVVVIKKNGDGRNISNAEKFYQFLFSEKAKRIFKRYGYLTEFAVY